ncbi:MAG TPA: hypothetical protein EYO90_10560, partial [Candidatus Latescibacteria bacterium]|nr:hypothetical protein [Candidatus Latescibacterota bacterium]
MVEDQGQRRALPFESAFVVHDCLFATARIVVGPGDANSGRDIYLVQPTCPPVNETLMELLIMLDCCKRASA